MTFAYKLSLTLLLGPSVAVLGIVALAGLSLAGIGLAVGGRATTTTRSGTQLNVTSASSMRRAPAWQFRRAFAGRSRGQPVRAKSPSVSTASVLPSQL
jgi:ABC-type molybdate transport system substrate-binding protein